MIMGFFLRRMAVFFLMLFLFNCEILQASFIFSVILQGKIEEPNIQKLRVKACLLPKDHRLQDQLKNLFEDHPDMFQSPEHLKQAGFNVFDKIRRGFMVASHPAIKNYLIKKFQDGTSHKAQLRNYLRRINGARTLSGFIRANKIQHIVTPQKWLYPLPKQFSDPETGERTYVLIVEEVDICSGGKDQDGEIARRYFNMDFEILRELCTVLYYFRGLDSGLQNMPFTYDNKIAFIDTEHWKSSGREGFLRFAMQYMSQDRQDYALEVYKELKADQELSIL